MVPKDLFARWGREKVFGGARRGTTRRDMVWQGEALSNVLAFYFRSDRSINDVCQLRHLYPPITRLVSSPRGIGGGGLMEKDYLQLVLDGGEGAV